MRGFLQPSIRSNPSDAQKRFSTFARGRRNKLAQAAQTTLLKADQWARGESVAAEVATALDKGVASVKTK
jgi:hypothetical protein